MIPDDRVWTVRFRRDLADRLRQRAADDDLTVQQVIIMAVERYFAAQPEPESDETLPEPKPATEQDLYQYGGGTTVTA
ncbi:MAG: hypothetical protein NZ518_04875 [Dehalococcoidia bacterium]|nr:hypothetical protein [Dehalococcoidia bacterium]